VGTRVSPARERAEPEDLHPHRRLAEPAIEANTPTCSSTDLAEAAWGGEVENVAVLVAIGVRSDGYREILGCVKGRRRTRRAGGTSCGI